MSLFNPRESTITITRNQPVAEKEFSWHGTERGYRYGTHKRSGTEYAVLQGSKVEPGTYELRPGELFVSVKRDITVDGQPWDETVHLLAMPVPPGTWDDVEQRQKAREARRTGSDRPPRVVSALVDLLRKASTDPQYVVLGKQADEATSGAMQAATGIGGPMLLEVKPKTLVPTPAGFLAYFSAKTDELRLASRDTTRLWVTWRVPPSAEDRALLRKVEAGIVMELGGPKVLCIECDAPGVQPIEPSGWACAEHLQ